jgi:predicted patatin/cPLA2 family phospholipase
MANYFQISWMCCIASERQQQMDSETALNSASVIPWACTDDAQTNSVWISSKLEIQMGSILRASYTYQPVFLTQFE